MIKKIILLDRDGVINQDSPHYIKSEQEFIFLPGSIEAIARLTQAGYRLGIATNQSGLARGYYSKPQLAAIHEKMLAGLRQAGGDIEAIEYCPHHPDEKCPCRKPHPQLLQSLANYFQCDLTTVPFIGDKLSDLEAAKRAGAQGILLAENHSTTAHESRKLFPTVPIYPSLGDYVTALLNTKQAITNDCCI